MPLTRTIALPDLRPATNHLGQPEEVLSLWWSRALTLTSAGYIVASQGLTFFSGWSRIGFLLAIFQLLLLAAGVCLKVLRFRGLGWVWIGLLFFAFAVIRAVPQPGHHWRTDALFQILSALCGGVGVALALQAGASFRALALAQTVVFLANVVAGLLGLGTESPAEMEAGRASGLTGNANELALQLTLGACLIWMFPKRAGTIACSLGVAAVAYAFATTGSRKGLLALAIFVVLAGVQLFYLLKGRRWIFLLAAPVVVSAAILTPVVLQMAKGVVSVQRALDFGDSSASTRMGMAQQAMRLWKEAPLVGWGTDAFSRISGYGMYAHNNFAELLCDLGLVGTLLFYSLHFYILIKCFKWPMPAKLYGLIFLILLLALDLGSVSYTRKQTIMVLMVLASLASNPARLGYLNAEFRKKNAPGKDGPKPIFSATAGSFPGRKFTLLSVPKPSTGTILRGSRFDGQAHAAAANEGHDRPRDP